MRAVREREIIVRLRTDDESGALVDATGTPTVSVLDGAGAAVVGVSVAKESDGVYTATIPARDDLDTLDVTWTATVGGNVRKVRDKVQVVSERLVPLWRLQEDDEMRDLSAPALNRIADVVEMWFRRALRFPPVLEGARASWYARESGRLHVPDVFRPVELYELSLEDTAADLSLIRIVDSSIVYKTTVSSSFLTGGVVPRFSAGVWTAYLAHGLEDPPEDLRRAAAIFARYVSRTNNYPERASRVVSAETEITFSVPSPARPTGLPEVDAVIADMAVPIV